MASNPNVYSADPAFPVLADSLLRQSESRTEEPALSYNKTPNSNTNWSLEEDWIKGIQPIKEAIFRCGVVLGFSRLRMRSRESDEYIGQVRLPPRNWLLLLKADSVKIPRYLLTKHLRSITPSHEPSAFIIHPGNFEAFAPRTLLNDLQSSSQDRPGFSREESIQKLDSVQLLPVHNFFHAAQAIGKVSDTLQGIKEDREQPTESKPPTHAPIVLIVAGLDYLTEGVIRASNPARGAALLSATLRTLTKLSRVHASHLSIILLNTNGLGTMNSEWDKASQSTGNHAYGDGATRQPLDEGIHSIFNSDVPSLFPTLLMKTLDQGIDTHFLVCDSRGEQVVEVIKDRVGTGLGKWGTWSQ
jgi:hypothetical protein